MARSPFDEPDPDQDVRAAAFDAIEKLSRLWSGKVPWKAIAEGFPARGQRVLFANRPKGIFKPKQMSAALSIKTGVPRRGRSTWYRDQEIDPARLDGATGLLRYDLARGGLNDPTNRALREAWRRKAPLIYFMGIAEAVFRPIFPVWIADFRLDGGEAGCALVATDDFEFVESKPATVAREEIEASYSATTTYRRNHQAWFSTLTKAAYQWRCAFSGLPVRALLVGAHIVPDAEGGPPSVRNGICMSALHHVAFDSHLIGVDPDYRVHVSSQLRDKRDGELLEGLKGLHGARLGLPEDRDDWPMRDYLERRFARYRETLGIEESHDVKYGNA